MRSLLKQAQHMKVMPTVAKKTALRHVTFVPCCAPYPEFAWLQPGECCTLSRGPCGSTEDSCERVDSCEVWTGSHVIEPCKPSENELKHQSDSKYSQLLKSWRVESSPRWSGEAFVHRVRPEPQWHTRLPGRRVSKHRVLFPVS